MAAEEKLHIAMFPWLAFGHIISYLELCKRIAQKGHRVSYISTPRNIGRLPKLHPDLASFINFVELPLPPVDGLPEKAEATNDIPYHEVQYLKKAYDDLQESLAFGGPSSGDYRVNPEDFTVLPKWIPFPTNLGFRYFEIMRIFDAITGNITGVSDLDRMKMSVDGSDLVVVRGCPEFEQEWFQVLRDIYGKPVFPIGQLPTSEYDTGDDSPAWDSIKQWLDKRAKGSVVYVAFGSETKPNQEVNEIAFGLEQSELPFFWVFRSCREPTDPDSTELPDRFEERTKGRGVVCTSWAPQLKILGHDSVGGFLTHGGWSSVVEAVQSEKALILLSFLAQGVNARIVEEKKMGHLTLRNDMDGSFTRKSVAESLKLVMVDEDGMIYRERIKEMKDLFVNEEKDVLIDQFLDYLKIHGKGTVSAIC